MVLSPKDFGERRLIMDLIMILVIRTLLLGMRCLREMQSGLLNATILLTQRLDKAITGLSKPAYKRIELLRILWAEIGSFLKNGETLYSKLHMLKYHSLLLQTSSMRED